MSPQTNRAVAVPPANATCTLMLYLDLTTVPANTDGLFAGPTPTNPSKQWQWTDNGQSVTTPDHLLVVSKANNNPIQTQITFNLPSGNQFYDTTSIQGQGMGPNTESALRITVVVARNKKRMNSNSVYASPFASANGAVQTVFDQCYTAASLSSPPVLSFGTPTLSSTGSGNRDFYALIVAVTGNTGSSSNSTAIFTASHDPEMEINM